MAKTAEIISLLNEFAPLNTAQDWDNSGWQVNFDSQNVNKIMLALTVTKEVVSQAIESNCDFILSHHPVFFEPVKKIEEKYILDAIENKIQIFSMHTNLDVANGGTTDVLAQKAGFKNCESYNDFVRVKHLDNAVLLDDFILNLKIALNLEKVKVINNNRVSSVKSVAFCAGSGGSFISQLKNSKIDLYITGDVKYHEAIDAENLAVLDIGHFDSEKFVSEIFKGILKGTDVEIVVANEKNIWQIV